MKRSTTGGGRPPLVPTAEAAALASPTSPLSASLVDADDLSAEVEKGSVAADANGPNRSRKWSRKSCWRRKGGIANSSASVRTAKEEAELDPPSPPVLAVALAIAAASTATRCLPLPVAPVKTTVTPLSTAAATVAAIGAKRRASAASYRHHSSPHRSSKLSPPLLPFPPMAPRAAPKSGLRRRRHGANGAAEAKRYRSGATWTPSLDCVYRRCISALTCTRAGEPFAATAGEGRRKRIILFDAV